jgi:hypothetical protein
VRSEGEKATSYTLAIENNKYKWNISLSMEEE